MYKGCSDEGLGQPGGDIEGSEELVGLLLVRRIGVAARWPRAGRGQPPAPAGTVSSTLLHYRPFLGKEPKQARRKTRWRARKDRQRWLAIEKGRRTRNRAEEDSDMLQCNFTGAFLFLPIHFNLSNILEMLLEKLLMGIFPSKSLL